MARMPDIEAEARAAAAGQPVPPIPTAQEQTMTRIAAAKEAADRASAALAGLALNPLAEAVAETGAGATLDPAGVRMVLGLVSVIERNALSPAQAPGGPVPAFMPAPPQDGPGAPQAAQLSAAGTEGTG